MPKKVVEERKPIITLTISEPGMANGLVESFTSIDEFYDVVWKHQDVWTRTEGYKLNVLFGHKFYRAATDSRRKKRVWIKNASGKSIDDMNG